MTVTESRLRTGALTLGGTVGPAGTGGTTFACQATSVELVPSYKDDGDATETLCGDSLAVATVRSDALKITTIQDFTNPAGFIKYCWDHDMSTVAFTWKPTATGPTFSGLVQVRVPSIGGEVNKRLTSDVEWDVVGVTTWTPPA